MSRGTYGARRIHAELTLGLGITAGRAAVERLMRLAGIVGLPGNRRPRPRHQLRKDAPNAAHRGSMISTANPSGKPGEAQRGCV
jgi:transposase InsO family protein